MTRALVSKVLNYWMNEVPREKWFSRDKGIDAEIKLRFGDLHTRAMQGRQDHWQDYANGCLALIILLDQFSRNLYRGDPRSFSSDEKCVGIAKKALNLGYDMAVPEDWRFFFYMPFEHSEYVEDQELSIKLFKKLGNPNLLRYAELHRDVIVRFNRFPARNAAMGRASTQEEDEYLSDPDRVF